MEKKLRNLYVLNSEKKDDSNYYASDQNLLIRHHLLV